MNQLTKYFKVGGKENNKNISPQPLVDPKKAQLKKKAEQKDEDIQEVAISNKKAGNRKSSKKEDILNGIQNKYLSQNGSRKKTEAFQENSRDSTPIKSTKKQENQMDIEDELANKFGLKGNKNSLLKQQKGNKAIQIVSDESQQENDVEIIQDLSGIKKKKKLTKNSEKQEKQKANKKPTKKETKLIIDSENTEEESDEEDSIKGEVIFADDEINHVQQNKRVDKMIQNQLEFKQKQQQQQQPLVDKKSHLANFLPIQSVTQPSTTAIEKNFEMINLDVPENDEGNNSDEEKMRQIEELEKLRFQEVQSEKQQQLIIISDSPVKSRKLESSQDMNKMEEEINEHNENMIINLDSSSCEEIKLAPTDFKDKKFFLLGDFIHDKKLITEAIQDNKGAVISRYGDINVLGDSNIKKHQLDTIKSIKINLIKSDEFYKLLEDTLQMSMEQIIEKYKQVKSQRDSLEKENKDQDQKEQKPQIPAKMTTSQQSNVQTQKAVEEKPKQFEQKSNQQQQQQKSSISLLSSFLHTSSTQFNQSIVDEQEEQESSIEIISENSKNISQSQVISNKPFFTKDKLQKTKSQPIVFIDENNEMKDSTSMEIEKKTPISQPIKPVVKTIKEPAKMMAEPKQMDKNLQCLWTHKYAPKELKDCVGNDQSIKKLDNWLVNWENVVIHKQKAQGNWKENPGSRACLISGPPGIGKTSTVRLLAQKYNMNIIEWNASDVRNKNAIESIINPLKDNQVLNFNQQTSTQRSIILMDEVDGMSSGDIGGNQALIKIIKETKNPIFCVCNDRYSQKLRSLSNSCFDVRFYKPNKNQIGKRLQEVCYKEGLKADLPTLEILAESVNNDIRQALNLLQMQSKKSKEISFKILMQGLSSFKKDDQVSMSPFEAAKVLMTKVDFDRKKLSQKLDLFFLDYELVPMLIHENYLATITTQKYNDANISELESMVEATSAMAESDILSDSIRSGGNWSLLQNQGFLTSVYVPEKVCNKNTAFPQMSQYLGKFSSQRKTSRLIRELRMKLSQSISGNRYAVQFDYAKPLMELIMNQLENNGKDGVENVVDIMEYYNITPELLKEHLIIVQYESDIENRLKAVPTALKTQLTRSYNKRFKNDVKPEKKVKKSDDEQHIKYDDVLGEFEDVDINEEEDILNEEDEETNDNSQQLKQSQASTKSISQKNKAQSVKNVKDPPKDTQQKNSIKSLFTKGKK